MKTIRIGTRSYHMDEDIRPPEVPLDAIGLYVLVDQVGRKDNFIYFT